MKKAIKIAALAVFVLAIMGVGLWLTGSSTPTPAPKPIVINSVDDITKSIDRYVNNLKKWDKGAYESLERKIVKFVQKHWEDEEENRDKMLNLYCALLSDKTSDKLTNLLNAELNKKSCKNSVANNLGAGVQYFNNKIDNPNSNLKAVLTRYYAYCKIYKFVKDSKEIVESPKLENYFVKNFSDPYPAMEEKLVAEYEKHSKLADKNKLFQIEDFRDCFEPSNITKIKNEANKQYHDNLTLQFTEYSDAKIKEIENAIRDIEQISKEELRGAKAKECKNRYEFEFNSIYNNIDNYNSAINNIIKDDNILNAAYNQLSNYEKLIDKYRATMEDKLK